MMEINEQIKACERKAVQATTQLLRVRDKLATCEENIKALKSFDQLLEANKQELKENKLELKENEAKLEENNQDLNENKQDLKENNQDLKLNQKELLDWRGKLDAAQQAGNSAREANAQAAIDFFVKAEQRLEDTKQRLNDTKQQL